MKHAMFSHAALICAVVTNCVSLCACVWLLGSSLRWSAATRENMLSRSIRCLAVSDLFLHFALTCICFEDLLLPSLSETMRFQMGDPFCKWSFVVLVIFRLISWLHELHIACECVAAAFRSTKVLRLQRRALPFLWIIGFLLGLYDAIQAGFHFNRICEPHRELHVSTGVAVVCAVICVVSYVLVSVQAFKSSPRSVQRRNLWRLLLYPSNFLATYGLVVALYIHVISWSGPVYDLVLIMESLNGFLNMATYAWQIRGRRKGQGFTASINVSYPVAFELDGEGQKNPQLASPGPVCRMLVFTSCGDFVYPEHEASAHDVFCSPTSN